jgi:hypothetical protein
MANTNSPFGFVPTRHLSGFAPRANKYTIGTGYATTIFNGDMVVLAADGEIEQAAATNTNNVGVFAGVSYTASDGSYVYSEKWTASTAGTNIIAYVYDDPYTVYKVQSAGTPAQTNIGNCADIVVGSGSTTTGQSGGSISGTMAAGTAQCKIIGLYDSPENSMAQYAVMEVLINEHVLKQTAGI